MRDGFAYLRDTPVPSVTEAKKMLQKDLMEGAGHRTRTRTRARARTRTRTLTLTLTLTLTPNPNPYQGSKLALAVPEMFLYFVIICYLVHFAVKLGRTKTVTGKFSNHFRDPCARPSPTREL